MKQCPACKTTYTDDSLSFCLEDGAPLDSAVDEQPTVVKNLGNSPMRVDIPSTSRSGTAAPPTATESERASAPWLKILLAVVILGILAIGAVGLIGAVFYYGTGGKEKDPPAKSQTPTPTATPDAEKERLRDEIANIQKRLDEQKTNVNTRPFPVDDDEPAPPIAARVNSPGDGFLALRSMPDSERGERVARIPHGAEIEIYECEKTRVTISGRTGRWCQAEYNGRPGWVFDAWLNY